MKKIICFLLSLQLVAFAFYGLLYLRSFNYYNLLSGGNTLIELNITQDEMFDEFLEVVAEKGLTAQKVVWPELDSIHFFTMDVTIGGRIILLEGRFPKAGTAEFISTARSGSENQVGVLADLVPGHTIQVAHMDHPLNLLRSGFYELNSQDADLLLEIGERLPFMTFNLREGDTGFRDIFFSLAFQEFQSLQTQLTEFIFIFIATTLCIVVTLIQFVSDRLKHSAIYLTHGFSNHKIIKTLCKELLMTAGVSVFFVFIFVFLYLSLLGRLFFLGDILRFLGLVAIVFTLFYMVLVSVAAYLLSLNVKVGAILKGQKYNFYIQPFNHLMKPVFTGFVLVSLTLAMANFQQLQGRLEHSASWEMAQNVYRLIVTWTGNISPAPMENRIAFYEDLTADHRGFMMDAYSVYFGDQRRLATGEINEPLILNQGHDVWISPSFLGINPIYDFEGRPVKEVLIEDDYVLNIILPERFMFLYDQIQEQFLAMFQAWRDPIIQWETPADLTITPRTLNIIQVPDGQYYFSFNSRVRPNTGGRIKDPIGIVRSGRLANEFILSALTHSIYFQATSNDPFSEIEPLIQKHGLYVQIVRFESIYNEFFREQRRLQDHHQRLLALMTLLVVANLAVTYNLTANYFQRFKFHIFLKSTFGWNHFKQNKGFYLLYLSYSVPLVLILAHFLGGSVLIWGVFFLLLDLMFIYIFQRGLFKKSLSELLKGER